MIRFTTLFKISCSFLVTSSEKRKRKNENEKKFAVCIYSGLSLLAALIKDPGEGRNPDMSYWETQVMEEGEQKENVGFFYFFPAEDSRNCRRINFTLSIRKRLSIKKWARKIAPGKKTCKELSPKLFSEVDKVFLGM